MPVCPDCCNNIVVSQVKPQGYFAAFDAIASWLLGVSLICSSTPHLGNPYFFLGAVYGYRMVGPGIGQIVAMIFPFLEVVLAACLIANLFRDAAHAITLALLVIFVVVQTSAKLRGLGIPCGCFGPRHETMIGWLTLSIVYGLLFFAIVRLAGYRWSARTEKRVCFGEKKQVVCSH